MSAETNIEWTDHTWSPWRGCTKVSPGCANCYAEGLAKRYARVNRWLEKHPDQSWDANPWVWVYEFRRVKP